MDNKKITVRREKNNVSEKIHSQKEEHSVSENPILNPILQSMKSPLLIPSLYGIAGIFVFIFLVFVISTRLLCLKVETAVVTSQIETMMAPMNGYITELFVTLGEQVKKGAPLLKIENIDLERELNLAQVHVKDSKLTAAYYENLLKNEQERLKVYQGIGAERVISSQTILNISKHEAVLAKSNLERYTQLYKKHYVSRSTWEIMHSSYLSAQEKLKNSRVQQRMEEQSFNALDNGLYFTGNKTEGRELDLNTELDIAKKRVLLNEERVQVYKHLINKLTLKAPFDGKVIQILKSQGNTTDNIKPIIFFEHLLSNKNIVAYLTQDEIMDINASKKVKVYLPSTGKNYHGKVIEINRTDGFVDAIKAQYRWRDFQIDRSAMVTIEIEEKDKGVFNQYTFSGMPAVIYFSKNLIG